MRYKVLAYGSDILPNIDQRVDTVCISKLFLDYPFVVIFSQETVTLDMLKAAVEFRPIEYVH